MRRVAGLGLLSAAAGSRGFSTTRWRGRMVHFPLADIGEGILKVDLLQWFIKEGDTVKEFDKLCEVESDKAKVEITSRYAGKVTKLHTQQGGIAFVGKPLIDIDVPDTAAAAAGTTTKTAAAPTAASPAAASPAVAAASATTASGGKSGGLATPAVRRIAMENNLRVSDIKGTGKDGRVTKEDILAVVNPASSPPSAAATPVAAPAADEVRVATTGSSSSTAGVDSVVSLTSGVRKAMVASMTRANEIPAFGASDEVELGQLIRARAALAPVFLSRPEKLKLSFMPFFVKAASLALKEFPVLNAHTNADCTALTIKGSHNIGFAVDTPEGLIVPNVKNVQDKTLYEVALDINALIEKAKKRQLTPGDLQGGTFTLSNIGSIGATYCSPVIMPPQVAIGALGRAQRLPRFDAKGDVYAASIMCVSWSADHRVIDGATMVRFSNRFKALLEDPVAMIVDMK